MLRGLSGAGKSEISKEFSDSMVVDLNSLLNRLDWDGSSYDKELFETAYKHMLNTVVGLLQKGEPSIVIVAPTVRERDVELYRQKTIEFGYQFYSVIVEYNGYNFRDVPEHILEYQADSLRESMRITP